MNTNLLHIARRIVAEQGEAILANPQRLKGFINDYAKNEPPADRLAFGRCIEGGYYAQFKNARDDAARRALKAALLPHLAAASGQSAAVCQSALDLLDALLVTQQPQHYAPHTGAVPYSPPRKMSKKTGIFGIAAGAGALAGELISDIFEFNSSELYSFWSTVGSTALWAALLGLGISAGLLIAQNIILKKKPDSAALVRTVGIGVAIGTIAGGLAQIIFSYTANISVPVEVISRALCWGILGWGIGWGVSFFMPNYPVRRAMLAGALGGTIGGLIFRALFIIPDPYNRIIGVIILGAFIGLSISYIEEALREAWLTIIWGHNETTTVSLGMRPVRFGSSREADVYLPRRPSEQPLPIRAIFMIEQGEVIMDDLLTGSRQRLQHGAAVDLGRIRAIVNIKKAPALP